MKTVIYDPQLDAVINVGLGEPEGAAPQGLEYIVVADDVFVGPGCKRNEDGSFYAPPPEED
jgi:hypothetical protein